MAESRQFGGGRVFGDKTPGNAPGASEHCAQCEAMLADALDGTLSAADQAIFDLHVDGCEPCGQIVADARRGAAWLEMLRHPAPEPPADLLERILAQTSAVGLAPAALQHHTGMAGATFGAGRAGEAAVATGYTLGQVPGVAVHYANVIPFPRRAVAAVRRTAFGQVMLQPRLVMTAAMAFFSVALTINITGFHPTSLRASDLKPSNLQRDVISAKTHVAQYYGSLRVVYELESRVHDLQSAQDTDVPAQGEQPSAQPADQAPASQPATQPEQHKAAPQPAGKRPAPGSGSSRRDDVSQPRRLVVSESIGPAGMGLGVNKQARFERKLV